MRLRIVLLGAVALAGCRQKPGSTGPDAVQADTAAPDPVETCERSCARLDACTGELVTQAYGDDGGAATATPAQQTALGRAFPYACEPGCAAPDERIDSRVQADCVSLQSCDGFYACATGTAASGILSADEADPVCEQSCARVSECAQDESVERRCLERCTALEPEDEARTELSQCPRSCEGLESCYDRWLLGAPTGLTAPPGVSDTCDALCLRGIACGAEDAGLTASELDEVASTMTDTYVECAVQCQADLRDETKADYERCAAEQDCEKFRSCAEKL